MSRKKKTLAPELVKAITDLTRCPLLREWRLQVNTARINAKPSDLAGLVFALDATAGSQLLDGALQALGFELFAGAGERFDGIMVAVRIGRAIREADLNQIAEAAE